MCFHIAFCGLAGYRPILRSAKVCPVYRASNVPSKTVRNEKTCAAFNTQHRAKLIINCVAGGFIRNTMMYSAHHFLTKAKENVLCLSVQILLPTAGLSCYYQVAFLSIYTL